MIVASRFGPVRVSRAALVGDPGLFSFLGKGLKGIGKFIAGGVRGLVGAPAGVARQLVPAPPIPALPGAGVLPQILPGALPGMMQQVGLPGQIGHTIGKLIRGSGMPTEFRNGMPVFPVSVSRGRRRMNVLNPRALRRALRRAQGFERFAKKTVSLTRRMKFKKRRRR